eukprot:s1008_g20.t1
MWASRHAQDAGLEHLPDPKAGHPLSKPQAGRDEEPSAVPAAAAPAGKVPPPPLKPQAKDIDGEIAQNLRISGAFGKAAVVDCVFAANPGGCATAASEGTGCWMVDHVGEVEVSPVQEPGAKVAGDAQSALADMKASPPLPKPKEPAAKAGDAPGVQVPPPPAKEPGAKVGAAPGVQVPPPPPAKGPAVPKPKAAQDEAIKVPPPPPMPKDG